VRSARRVSAAFAVTAPVAVLLTGCVSTQTVASRARLVDARIIASQSQTEVTQANPSVSVEPPVLIRAPGADAIVVSVRNDSARPATDLPISVGVRTPSGRTAYLNRSTALGYFDSHIASIGSRATTTWVFVTGAHIPPGRVFTTVGLAQLHPSLSRSLPSVAVSLRATQPERDDGVTLELSILNRSAIPQYYLPIYAVALRGDREVAAGRTTITHIGTHGTTTSTLELLGSPHYDSLHLIASPTIFN
jgi:hypothetical protein